MGEERAFILSDVKVFQNGKEIGIISRGTPVTILKGGGMAKVKVEGHLKDKDEFVLYGTSNFILPFVTLTAPLVTSKALELEVDSKAISANENDAWADYEFKYYDYCSQCHSAHAPKKHSMLEWEGIYSSMSAFAMPTEEDDKILLLYLRAHASDGFAMDDE